MVVQHIVNFLQNTEYKSLSEDSIETAKKCVLDWLGCVYAGKYEKAYRISRQAFKATQGAGRCKVIGEEEKTSPFAAVFTNATQASALDYDDGHRQPVGHPGSTVISTLWTISDLLEKVHGRDWLLSIICGYEIAIRCGIVMNSHHDSRFYGSGGWALFGAAAAGAKLMKLNQESTKNALTICEVHGPTAQCGKSISNGSMTKESVGWGSVTALSSLLLSNQGFTGPDDILLDKDIYKENSTKVFRDLGDRYEINHVYFKPFPSCKWTHSPITAALKIRNNNPFSHSDVQTITVQSFDKALTLDHKKPTTSVEAQYSIPYTLACALVHGDVAPIHVAEDHLNDEDIMSLINKVHLVHAPDLERHFPETRPARVIIKIKDGTTFTEEIYHTKGDPERPFSWKDIEDKFHMCSHNYYAQNRREQIIDSIRNLEDIEDLNELIRSL
ncbi:2-methylcitrate dehydratase PrpD [Halobacillus karajensis]|uniref:MmgE/PrpD family protein n=1 Tax=Halobacillus karajensis TaxID=195088 RepID=UPI0008A79212|nr:MmgE/PrpD family protein [Halobacillus karajensis]SEI03967.1 2-methylcitrate dehydratase PrpD [Halobacillus karajensis]